MDILSGADPDIAMGDTLTVREALDRGIVRIQESLRDQPEIEADLLSAAGRVYTNLGLFEQSAPLLARAVSMRDADDEASVSDLSRLALAQVRTDTDAGVASMREAVARAERLLPPDDLELARLLVDLRYHLPLEERRPLLERALRMLRASDRDVRKELSQALTVQAYSVDSMPLSESLHREALAIRMELHGGEHVTIATSMAARAASLLHGQCDTKVSDKCVRTREQNVFGFDVAVYDALRMRFGECACYFTRDAQRVGYGQLRLTLQPISQRFARMYGIT